MRSKILDALKTLSIEHFLIEHEIRETAELYFIRKNIDMQRRKDIESATVTLYRDFDAEGTPMRGSSSAVLSPDMDPQELLAILSETYDAAGSVKNPAFTLYEGHKEVIQEISSGFSPLTLPQAVDRMTKALFAADERSDAFVNSAELFVTRQTVTLISSAGSDVGYIRTLCEGEFVVQCKEPVDVEQYFSFRYEDLNEDALTSKVRSALDTVCDRSRAGKSPTAGVYDLILSGEQIKTILDFYVSRANASMVYAHYSDYQPGVSVQGEDVVGERLNLTLLPSAPYSNEGIPMPSRTLTDQSILLLLHGQTRFCRYLGVEPTGSYEGVRLDNGTLSFDDMKQGCLYPVSFSDFQMDSMSGHFGGEIRLAYLFTDKGVELLTGGSVNGSLLELQKNMVFSKERFVTSGYEGPFAVKFRGVNVSGG